MNEEQYYSPIINAMIHTASLQKQGAQQEIEKQKNADEKKLREQQLKQAQQQIDQVHEMNLKQSDLASKHLELQRQQHDLQQELTRMQVVKEAQGVLSNAKPGADITKIAPGLTQFLQGGGQQFQPQQSRQLPAELGGDQQPQIQQPEPQADLSGLFDPQAAVRKEADLVRAKGEAEAPFKQKEMEDQLKMTKELTQYKTGLENVDKKLDRESHERIARIQASARVRDPEVDPDMLKSLFMLKATGQIQLTPTNKTHMNVLSALEEGGARDFDKKEAIAMKESKKLIPIFDQMEAFSKKLSDSRPGAFVQGAVTKGLQAVGGSSELMNDWNILRSRAIVIGKALEGMTGRPLAVQLQTDLNSLPGPGITKKDAEARIKNLRELLSGVEDSLFTGMPDWQRDLVSKQYDIKPQGGAAKPDFLKLAPKVNKTGHHLDEEASTRMGQPVYK